MKVVSVVNHKGGVGKSTIATNLAGFYANTKKNVLLGDFDIQQSTREWLDSRPINAKPIGYWLIENGKLIEPPEDTDYIILDTPAGLRGNSLDKVISLSDKVIVPLKASVFDMSSSQRFLEEVIEIINENDKEIDLCVLGSMVEQQTRTAEQLRKFIDNLQLNSPTSIRQAQIYVHLAAHGLSIFDATNNAFDKEKEQWTPLIEWIENE